MLRIGKIHTTLVVWYTYKPFSCRCWPVGLLETSLLTCWGYGRLFLEEDLLALILLVVCATTLGTTPPLLILSLHVILLTSYAHVLRLYSQNRGCFKTVREGELTELHALQHWYTNYPSGFKAASTVTVNKLSPSSFIAKT